MAPRVYRVCRAIHARLDGQGAKRAGGRWNSPGVPVVYMAQSVSLAVLENLVHMSKSDFPVGYVTLAARIPDDLLTITDEDLAAIRPGSSLRELGDLWANQRLSAVLQVRSAVVPLEFNFLLNPSHKDFERIEVEPPQPFVFDARLFS